MKSWLPVSLLIGCVLIGGPLVALTLHPTSTAAWTDWVALVWVPGALISRWVLRLQPHDAPFVLWSIALSGGLYTVVSALLLKRFWK